jgi:hypothetical protein
MPIPTLTLTQTGQVLFLPDGGDGPAPPELVAAGIEDPFQEGPTAGLLHLGTAELTTALPSDFAFWRDFSRGCPTRLRRNAAVESEAFDVTATPPPPWRSLSNWPKPRLPFGGWGI